VLDRLRAIIGSPRFNRASAAFWLVLGVVAQFTGLSSSIPMLWFASVYANVKSDVGAAEAADNGEVMDLLREMNERLKRLEATNC
jgi:hypothetical protein